MGSRLGRGTPKASFCTPLCTLQAKRPLEGLLILLKGRIILPGGEMTTPHLGAGWGTQGRGVTLREGPSVFSGGGWAHAQQQGLHPL